MKVTFTLLMVLVVLAFSQNPVRAGLFDSLFGKKDTNAAGRAVSGSGLKVPLTQDQMAQGLKEALGKGVQEAVTQLGRDGGFLTNLNVRIPMPEQLRTVEKTLRTLKQDQLADQFVATMNHAAEKAVPEAASVFASAVQGITIADAKSILLGTNNAATEYFRGTTETNLHARFLPIVKQATDQAGVTSAYKQLMEKTQGSSLGSFGRTLLGGQDVDVDSYVTSKALDGLFKMVAQEEQRIRDTPAARTTVLLQKVFGAVGR